MGFVIVLVLACGFTAVAARSIKAVPVLWYGLAFALDVLYAYGIVFSLPPVVLQILSVVVQRAALATALFAIVMYIGVFPEHSAVRRRIGPIRGELSLIACILACGHCANYLSSYFGVLVEGLGAVGGNQAASLVIALVLLVLLLVLGATSIKALKLRMRASTWKSVQQSAYVFFGLIYVHEVFILYPSVIKGTGDALVTCVAGGIVFGVYFLARFVKYLVDRKKRYARSHVLFDGEGDRGAYGDQE